LDELAKVYKIASETQHNEKTGRALESFSNSLTLSGDLREVAIHRIEEKVLPDLTAYETLCRNSREEIRTQVMLRDRELSRRKQLEITKRSGRDLQNTEADIMQSNANLNKTLKEISNVALNFEKQKLTDLRESTINFMLIQMKYHASQLELLTKSYQEFADSIDEDHDLEVNYFKLLGSSLFSLSLNLCLCSRNLQLN